MKDHFNCIDEILTSSGTYSIFSLKKLENQGFVEIKRFPYSTRIFLENVLRNCDGTQITRTDVKNLVDWTPENKTKAILPFMPARVVMQDFTGVPVLVDLAAMRSALARLGGDPNLINPMIPVDLVVDHSIQVDYFGSVDALVKNVNLEYARNKERYQFLKWGERAFKNLRIIPPVSGIIHQINLEYLSSVVMSSEIDGRLWAYPDTLVGTDSHTTMINGLGVVGWGVGGIEAVAAMLKQPLEIVTPDVVGFELDGELPYGSTPTDLTLMITQLLRKKNVVGKIVEFHGAGLKNLALADRAMIANMTPENGATMTYFPVDDQTLDYLRLTGRSDQTIELVKKYFIAQGLYRFDNDQSPLYSENIHLDLADVEPSLAGPKRPQDRVLLREMGKAFQAALTASRQERGFEIPEERISASSDICVNEQNVTINHGAVVLASITSCTNTSNPYVMITAGLLAQKAVEKGLQVKPFVKTSLAPGSKVVKAYLEKAGLLDPLSRLGFDIVGYGCMTCIGNSGPLPDEVVKGIQSSGIVAASVISGNRNFEGRVNPHTLANYLASPPLVIAYALAGTVNIDLSVEPVGMGKDGKPVYLSEIWPDHHEVLGAIENNVNSDQYREIYSRVITGNALWDQLQTEDSDLYNWSVESTYIQEPPYFNAIKKKGDHVSDIKGARALVVLGDSITTDHISPAGAIPKNGAAGIFLQEKGVAVEDFNSFGSRRGNDRVMVRGTFGNIRLRNQLIPEIEGGMTLHLPDRQQMTIYSAAQQYQKENTPMVVLAGKEYGTGSSRDWAAKGPMLLGVKVIIAKSYERIHRSNLVGMGVLPLQFKTGEGVKELGLDGTEIFSIEGVNSLDKPGGELTVRAQKDNGEEKQFMVSIRIDTRIEFDYFKHGGILQKILMQELDK